MSRMLRFFAIAVVLFSLAAGVSWYLQGSGPAKEHDEKAAKSGDDHGRGKVAAKESPTRPTAANPVSPEAERVTAAVANLEKQQESLKSREHLLTVREKQLDLIHEEIK